MAYCAVDLDVLKLTKDCVKDYVDRRPLVKLGNILESLTAQIRALLIFFEPMKHVSIFITGIRNMPRSLAVQISSVLRYICLKCSCMIGSNYAVKLTTKICLIFYGVSDPVIPFLS